MDIREVSRKYLKGTITLGVFFVFVVLFYLSKTLLIELISPVTPIANAFNKEKNKAIDECTTFINARTQGKRTVQLVYLISDPCMDSYDSNRFKGAADANKDYFIFKTKDSPNNDIYIKKKAIFEILYFDSSNKLLYKSVINPEDYKK
jgi:hypothetical protein